MRILAIDTALKACSVGVIEGDKVLAALSEPMDRGHAERIAPMADEARRAAGITFDSIDRVVVTTGPGSFTGLRVGLAFGRAMALAVSKPCVGVSTLEALALEGGAAGYCAGAIDTAGGVYLALYRDGEVVQPPRQFTEAEAAAVLAKFSDVVVRGPGAAPFGGEIVAAPDIACLAMLGARRDPERYPPNPLYLRAPDAKPAARPATVVV